MVRLKNRWLLVKIDTTETLGTSQGAGVIEEEQEERCASDIIRQTRSQQELDSSSTTDSTTSLLPSRKELGTAIRQNISSQMGIAGDGIAHDVQVRFWDPVARLLLLRVPRNDCGKVRASLTTWTTMEILSQSSSGRTAAGSYTNSSSATRSHKPPHLRRVAASVLSVNGSARTAKRSTMLHIRKWYRGRLIDALRAPPREHNKRHSSTSSRKTPSTKGQQSKEWRHVQGLMTILQNIE